MANDIIDIVVTDNSDNVQLNVTPNLVSINVSQTSGNIIGSNYYLASTYGSLPITGDTTTLYVINDTSLMYRWSGSAYVQINSSAIVAWGQITGALSNQTDLTNALNAKAPLASPTFTGTVSGITKAMIGLSNVDNTSDVNKPVSSATQTALDTKAPLASPTFTGTVSGITKSMVGLGNVDNTTDLLKPISTATQSALNLKYDASNPAGYTTNVGTVTNVGGTGTVSGLSLSGSVTTSGNLTLGGTLSLTSGNVTTALGYTPYNATNPSGYISGITSGQITTALGYTPENSANKGIANGYASLDGGGLIPSTQLPSYVDDVLEFANLAGFPVSGTTGKIYVALDTNKIYRWSGATYIEVSPTVGTIWGGITGTLSNQTDLQNALNLKYNTPTGTTSQYVAGDGSLITFPVSGQSGTIVRLVRNTTGATLTKGTVVYISGATGNNPTVSKALATSDSSSAQTFGLCQSDIANNATGYVVSVGDLIGLDTSAFTEGQQLYLSGTTAGTYTATKQYAPIHLVYIGVITRSHPTQGQIEVRIQNGYELDELHNVSAQTPSNNDGIFYNTTTSLWENKSIATTLGYTPVTNARTITINGTALDLSANRSYSVGTVTSVSALTLATTGTDVSSTVATGTTTPIITLNIPTASASNRGALSSADWTTFNNKANALSGTTNTLAKFTSSTAIGNSNITDDGSLISLGSNTYISSGSWGIGISPQTNYGIRLARIITSNVNSTGISSEGQIQSDVTSTVHLFNSVSNTQAVAFTLANLRHYRAVQGTFGASSIVTSQTGFLAESNLTGATNNYGFYGSIPSGTNRWNIYMAGTASNYLAGQTEIANTLSVTGGTSAPSGVNGIHLYFTSNVGYINALQVGVARALTILGYPLSFGSSNSGTLFAQFNKDTGNLILQNGGTFTDAGYKLDVTGTARVSGSAYFATASGSVGIGTTSPNELLVAYGLSTSRPRLVVGQLTTSTPLYSTYNTQDTPAIEVNTSTTNGFAGFTMSNSNNTSGNTLGTITFAAAGTSNGEKRGAIIGSSLESVATSSVTANLVFYTTSASSVAERMRITSAGNVGIGTTSPNALFQITSSSFPVLKVADGSGGGAIALGDSTISDNYNGIWRGAANSISGGGFLNIQGNGIAFMSGNNTFGNVTERMRITNDGKVLIGGTSSDGYGFQVYAATSLNGQVKFTQVTASSGYVNETLAVNGSSASYFLNKDTGTSNGSSTTTFNIGGLSNAAGTIAHITLRVSKAATASAINTVAYVQINGVDMIGLINANGSGANTIIKTFTVVYNSTTGWQITGAIGTY